MKFVKYLAIAFAGVLMASCDEDFNDWASPIKNPEEVAITIPGYTATAAEGAVIDMANAPATVKVLTLAGDALPEGFTLENIRLKATPEGVENAQTYEIDLENDGTVETATLNSLTEEVFGRRPVARTFNCKVLVDAVKDGQAVLINAGSIQIKVTPTAPHISQHYYLIGDIEGTSWGANVTAMPFKHSDKDVYDDPVFTITFPVKEGDNWFAFIDDVTVEKNDWAYVYACTDGNGENGETGKICRRNEIDNEGSFKVNVKGDAKYVKMTINLMDGTYKLEKINFALYYEIGNESGWKTTNALCSPKLDENYQGYYWLDGEFKFKPLPGTGSDDWAGDLEFAGDNKVADIPNGPNFTAPKAGFYQINLDLNTNTYSLVAINSITCVGKHNDWNEKDEAQHMTYNATEGCWELTTKLTNGFKFAANDDWALSWGGADGNPEAYDNLTQFDGKDFNVPNGDGTYKIQLYLSYEGANRVVLTKQ